jgi:hypothetical protein
VSLPHQLHDETLARLRERLGLAEVAGAGGGPWLDLVSKAPIAQGSVGSVRVFRGKGVFQVVTCSIVVEKIGLDSHMLFAFTDTEGAVPHFTVDSVRNGPHHAFHLDFIPRVDLATELGHMDEVFAPLTPAFKAHRDTPGLSAAHLDPRQYAVMSPWMLANRADEAAFKATFATVNTYLDHWFRVLEGGVKAAGRMTPAQRAARDEAHRAILFSPAVDPVWNQITPLIGADAVSKLIGLLRQTRA